MAHGETPRSFPRSEAPTIPDMPAAIARRNSQRTFLDPEAKTKPETPLAKMTADTVRPPRIDINEATGDSMPPQRSGIRVRITTLLGKVVIVEGDGDTTYRIVNGLTN